jgi:hypothetical protein
MKKESFPNPDIKPSQEIERLSEIDMVEEFEAREAHVSLEIFYTAHLTASDFIGLHEKIEQADIFVPEVFGWAKDVQREFQKVANGEKEPHEFLDYFDLSPERFAQYDAMLGMLEALYKTKKRVAMVDVPTKHAIEGKFYAEPDLIKTLNQKEKKEKIEAFKDYLQHEEDVQTEREGFITDQLKALIAEETEKNNKRDVRVVMFLGSIHSRVFHTMKREGVDVSRDYPVGPYVFNFIQEAKRRAMFGKELPEDLITRAIAQWYLETFILTPEARELTPLEHGQFHRFVIGELSDEEINGIVSIPSIKKGVEKLKETLFGLEGTA